jgi:histidinol phosphatase-like PHP family hydrolase
MNRRNFIKNTSLAAGMITLPPLMASCAEKKKFSFPLVDLHVHLTEEFPIERMMQIAGERGVKFGIVEHPAEWAIKNDADLRQYIDKLRKYPVFIGLQPMVSGWEKSFSPELLAELDYILMDPQTIPTGNGEYQRIWQLDTYVDDAGEFMERYMAHCLNILKHEAISIFGWPLFLPVCIARDYYTLWTRERMTQLIDAAAASHIAIEINDMAHTPHEEFINMAREAKLKFTFGSDSRNQNAGRLAYCISIAQKCNLREDDFFVPLRAPSA